MKRKLLIMGFIFVLIITLLCGCGTSEEASAVIDKIESIGDVDYDDEELIGACEDAYLALTSEQQGEVINFSTLAEARRRIDELIAAKPIPFSDANWETTPDELVEMYGKPEEEYDSEYYGHMLSYPNVEHEGYMGTARYGFENGKLTRVFFAIDGYDEAIIEYFDDLFQTKYGNPSFENEYGLRWDTAYVSCGACGTKLFGGSVNVTYMTPKLLEE